MTGMQINFNLGFFFPNTLSACPINFPIRTAHQPCDTHLSLSLPPTPLSFCSFICLLIAQYALKDLTQLKSGTKKGQTSFCPHILFSVF